MEPEPLLLCTGIQVALAAIVRRFPSLPYPQMAQLARSPMELKRAELSAIKAGPSSYRHAESLLQLDYESRIAHFKEAAKITPPSYPDARSQ